MTDHDMGDDQDPLLVRPFVLHDSESPDADPSTQTWPSATTREVRSQHSASGESATQVIPRVAAPRRRFRRRFLVIGGVGAAVVLAAAAAAFAVVRPEMSPSVASGADPALPVVTGPAPSASAPPTAGSPSATSHGARRSTSTSASAKASASLAASSGTPSAAPPNGQSSAPTVNPTGGGFGVAQPHDASPTGRTGTIRGQNALCLDLNGNLPFDDNHIDVFDCNGTTAQVWTLATDGTLRVDGKCALIVGDNTVHIVSCDGRTTAQWHASNSTLVNAANGRCLTDPSGGRGSGTPVVVSTCGGSASQRWSLP